MDALVTPEPETTTRRFAMQPFRKAMAHLAPILTAKATIPPQLSLAAHAGQTHLRARGVDLEIGVTMEGKWPTLKSPFILPAALFRLTRPQLSATQVALTPDDDGNIIAAIDEDFSARLVTENPEPIPGLITNWLPNQSARLDRALFAKTLAAVAHAISTEETRYYLNGVHIHPHPDDPTTLSFVATDGHRLARKTITGVSHNLQSGLIIPRHAIHSLRGLLNLAPPSGAPDSVDLVIDGPRCGILADRFFLATNLIDGTFPDYARVIPQNVPALATFPASPLAAFCRRAACFGRGDYRPITLTTSHAKQTLTAAFASADYGTITQTIQARVASDLAIGFQHKYITAALGALAAAEVTLHARDATSPTILATAGELTDPTTTIVLMPMRI